jgi:hypothetical protein
MVVRTISGNSCEFQDYRVLHPDDAAGWEAFAREVEQRGYHIGRGYAELMAMPLTAEDLIGVSDYWRKILLRPIRLVGPDAEEYGHARGFDTEPGEPLQALGADVADAETNRRVRLRQQGYYPIPVQGKVPAPKAWQKLTELSKEEIEFWPTSYPHATNTGCLTKYMPTSDIDLTVPEAVRDAVDMIRARLEERGYVLVRTGNAPKVAIPLHTLEPFRKYTINLIAPNGAAEKIELLGDGEQIVCFGTHPTTGKSYSWHGGEPGQIRLDDLPYVSKEEAIRLVEDIADMLCREHGYSRAQERPKAKRKGNGADPDEGTGAKDWAYLSNNIRNGVELHDSLRNLAAKLARSGMDARAAVNLLRGEMNNSVVPRDERWQERYDDIPRLVDSAVAKFERPPQPGQPPPSPTPSTNKPVIQLRADEIPDIAKRAEQILIESECEIYQRGGKLVRPVIEEADASHGRKTKIARLVGIVPVYLRNELDKLICWERYNDRKRKWLPTGAPTDIANVILSQVGHWTFLRIGGVITTPTLRSDGSLLVQPGYDAATGLLLVAPPPMPPIPDRPTKEDALAAQIARGPAHRISIHQRSQSSGGVVRPHHTDCPRRSSIGPDAFLSRTSRQQRQIVSVGCHGSDQHWPSDAGDLGWPGRGGVREAHRRGGNDRTTIALHRQHLGRVAQRCALSANRTAVGRNTHSRQERDANSRNP